MTEQVLAIDFGGTKVALAVADAGTAEARPHNTVRLDTRAAEGTAQVVARALAAARDLVADPVAVGVSTFGVVRDGAVRLAPNVPGWDGLRLPGLLAAAFGGVPLAVDNDVNAGAAAELRWGALRGVDTALYVNVGTGLAAALVAGGRVLPGANGAAGEIGYLRDAPGAAAFADGRAPLEEAVSGSALARRGSALLGRPVTAAELFALYSDPAVAALLDDALEVLARTVANLSVVLDPQRVILAGGLMGAAEHILPRVSAALARAVPFPPALAAARFVDDAPLLGALSAALDLAAA
ncbi:ROK family protein [Dactylosporangium sp. NPDC049140]|uniref:ROK family protein n=1 Tax=Dactylosporangium sp. NPDC049140 TaxID=3155647 RepID=UPI0033D0E160